MVVVPLTPQSEAEEAPKRTKPGTRVMHAHSGRNTHPPLWGRSRDSNLILTRDMRHRCGLALGSHWAVSCCRPPKASSRSRPRHPRHRPCQPNAEPPPTTAIPPVLMEPDSVPKKPNVHIVVQYAVSAGSGRIWRLGAPGTRCPMLYIPRGHVMLVFEWMSMGLRGCLPRPCVCR